MKVFLSGKVDEHSGKWRDLLLGEKWVDGRLGPRWGLLHTTPDPFDQPFANWPVQQGIVLGTHDYVGPYRQTLTEDLDNKHFGYFHGVSSRGNHGQMDMDDQQRIVAGCMKAIENCDLFFAYLNTPDCFGTICEIGYARAKGKFIAVVVNDTLFSSLQPISPDDMWFACLMADFYYHVSREDMTEKESVERSFLEAVSAFVAHAPSRSQQSPVKTKVSHG